MEGVSNPGMYKQHVRRTSLPRTEVSPHQEVVEACDANQLQQFNNHLLNDGFFHVVRFKTLEDLVEEVQNVVHAELRAGVGV